jgi:hypothetical protein
MQRIIFTLVFSLAMAMLSADDAAFPQSPPPIVQYMDFVPNYGRRKSLKRHYNPFLSDFLHQQGVGNLPETSLP